MKRLTWEEFYDRYYDLPQNIRKGYAKNLLNFGDADEIYEVWEDLSFEDETFAAQFISNALDEGASFSTEQVMDLIYSVDRVVANRLAVTSAQPFSREQLDELYGMVDDNIYEYISRRDGIHDLEIEYYAQPPERRLGFWEKTAAVILGIELAKWLDERRS